MGQQGIDIQLSDKARECFPYAVECKSLAKIAMYKHFEQAQEHSDKENLPPLLIVKANRKKPLAIIDLEDFLKLVKQQ